MTSLLDFGNYVLAEISEPVLTVLVGSTDPTALKLLNAIRSGLIEIQDYVDWEWAYRTGFINVLLWSGNEVTISNLKVCHTVCYKGDSREIPIRGVSYEDFLLLSTDVSYNEVNANYPRIWAVKDHQTLVLDPYPTLDTEQNKIIFNRTEYFSLAEDDFEPLPIPANFERVLFYRVVAQMHMSLTANAGMAQNYLQLYLNNIQQSAVVHRHMAEGETNFYG